MNQERLEKVAEHLEKGVLGHDTFDFDVVTDGPRNAVGCGTNGCAMGELPFIFPEDWEFFARWDEFNVRLRPRNRESHEDLYDDVSKFFDITVEESYGLFTPDEWNIPWQEDEDFRLTGSATRQDVADNIRKFIDWKLEQCS